MSRITPYLLRPTAGNTLDPFYLKLFSMQPKFFSSNWSRAYQNYSFASKQSVTWKRISKLIPWLVGQCLSSEQPIITNHFNEQYLNNLFNGLCITCGQQIQQTPIIQSKK